MIVTFTTKTKRPKIIPNLFRLICILDFIRFLAAELWIREEIYVIRTYLVLTFLLRILGLRIVIRYQFLDDVSNSPYLIQHDAGRRFDSFLPLCVGLVVAPTSILPISRKVLLDVTQSSIQIKIGYSEDP